MYGTARIVGVIVISEEAGGRFGGRSWFGRNQRLAFAKFTEEKWSGRRGSNPQHPAWEGKYSALYFQHLQNRSRKICVHAAHTVHALPDLRVAAGRLRDVFSSIRTSNRRQNNQAFVGA